LHDYQQAATAWVLKHPEQKGLIGNLATGLGKTLVAINMARALRMVGRVDSVLILTKKSLIPGFKKSVELCTGHKMDPEFYDVMTYQKYAYSRKYRDLETAARTRKSTKRKRYMLIIDEAHNYRNAGLEARAAYRAAHYAEFTLLLTATIAFNHPSDVSFLMRLMGEKASNWPMDRVKFDEKYQRHPNLYVRNMQNLVAYKHDTPDTKPTTMEHIHHINMSKHQAKMIDDVIAKNPGVVRLVQQMSQGRNVNMARMNSFLTRVRQISNFVPRKELQPKVMACVKKAKAGPKPVIIFTAFRESGADQVKRGLRKIGVPMGRVKVFDGATKVADREAYVKALETRTIDYLIMTEAAKEGVSTKNVRQIHLLDPAWNEPTNQQRIGRAVRINSHTHLPPSQRHVHIHRWFSVRVGSVGAENPEVHLAQMAAAKFERTQAYDKLHAEASIPLTMPDYAMPNLAPAPPVKKNTKKSTKKRKARKKKNKKKKSIRKKSTAKRKKKSSSKKKSSRKKKSTRKKKSRKRKSTAKRKSRITKEEASHCAGRAGIKGACPSKCRKVKGSTRKNGRRVRSHCRIQT